ncbi:hypothetical protein FHETE_4895 [Fusarium heterosporum]|uniref:Uncharacterized protein n=1 Tax=Fusarium heterosporum TaxID=42747 RepID=A0A8H5TCG0_FUSHE|nr:hypothetical protein FHETE_4895 [Fusarium heterosporum]
MEPAVVFITMLAMVFVFSANTPMETPLQAVGAALTTGFVAILGGASFFAQILSSVAERFHEEDIPLENYMEHRPRAFYRSRAKFETDDRFYHEYGVCCSESGHCVSCVKQQAEDARKFAGVDQDEFDKQMKEALAT